MANVTALFVSETWLKERTPINAHVDIATIAPFVPQAQDLLTQPILGTDLYVRLMTGIVNSDLSASEVTLLEMIRPMLAYQTLYSAIPFVFVAVRNAGLVKTKTDNTENVGMPEMNLLRNEAENVAEFYQKRLQEYLCTNSALFPQYASATKMTARHDEPYSGGFYFEDGCGNCDLR